MPTRETVEAFVAVVVSGRHVEAIEQFYAEDASMQENDAEPRRGREVLMEGERRALARAKSVTTEIIGPVLIDGDTVAIRWRFVFTSLADETRVLDEVAWQRWRGEKVAEERFFYDPAWRTPA
jgi:hypothetical protein